MESNEENIFDIIKKNDFKFFEEYVRKHGTEALQAKDSAGNVTLHAAINAGNKEIIQYILDMHVVDNCKSTCLQFPIHWACTKGDIDIVKISLQYGFDIDSQDSKGYTPIILAAQNGHTPLIIYLISQKAKLDCEDLNGDNALHWAAYKGHSEIISLLIYFGLNPKRCDNYGQNALHLACLNGNIASVKQLVTQVDLNSKDNQNNTALELALGMSKRKSAKRLASMSQFLENQKEISNFDEIVKILKRNNSRLISSFCDRRSLWFGPIFLDKEIFILCHLILLFIQYPLYIYYGVPITFENYKLFNYFYIFVNFFVWVTLYGAHLSSPGFLKFDVKKYDEAIKRLQKCLAKMCHTCKLVRPYRSSHCRTCNRCVLAFDHHCPYIGNCVGYSNRLWFYSFTLSVAIMASSNLRFCFIVLYENSWYYPVWLATLMSLFYAFMAISLFISTTASAVVNLTSNEYVKKKKYEYLSDSNGRFRNIFDKGFMYNLKYYFYLIQASNLETEAFEFNLENFV